ncbi:MAG: TRIC cation channel family protein [Cyanobacteria bacterium P01_H01_bin.15]
MLTATGGGLIHDIFTRTKPIILSAGELYATAALGGAFVSRSQLKRISRRLYQSCSDF